jgi:hypothetical protein
MISVFAPTSAIEGSGAAWFLCAGWMDSTLVSLLMARAIFPASNAQGVMAVPRCGDR